MDDTVTLQTLLIVGAPIAGLLFLSLLAQILGGLFGTAWRRLIGSPTAVQRLESRIAQLEQTLARSRASELPIEIEAEHLAKEIEQLEAERRDNQSSAARRSPIAELPTTPPADSTHADSDRDEHAGDDENAKPAAEPHAELPESGDAPDSEQTTPLAAIELPPDPNETEEDRIAREQLEAEERERIELLAAEEARIRQEREEAELEQRTRVETEAKRRREEQQERDRIENERRAEEERIERERLEAEEKRKREAERIENERRAEEERIERERLEAEATRKREEEQRRKAEEFRRRVAGATPKIVMSAGGSNREAVTVNVAVTNNLTPKHAEIAVLSSTWAREPAPALFGIQRKDGLYEERWPKHARIGAAPAWTSYRDAAGRSFDCPTDEPTEDQAWIVISYDRTAGGPASTWQRFEVGGAGALWYVRQAVGDPIVIEANRQENEAAA